MVQDIFTLIIVFLAIAYTFYAIINNLIRKNAGKCDGCSGCSLKQTILAAKKINYE